MDAGPVITQQLAEHATGRITLIQPKNAACAQFLTAYNANKGKPPQTPFVKPAKAGIIFKAEDVIPAAQNTDNIAPHVMISSV